MDVLTIAAGAAGGLLMGITGFILAHKDGEAFDGWFLLKTCWLPMMAGVVAGLTTDNAYAAALAGVMLKHLAEVKSSMSG
jgi:hypothetical protein